MSSSLVSLLLFSALHFAAGFSPAASHWVRNAALLESLGDSELVMLGVPQLGSPVLMSDSEGVTLACSTTTEDVPPSSSSSSSTSSVSAPAAADGPGALRSILATELPDTCVEHTAGWWTYLYCHGKGLKQFHKGLNNEPEPDTVQSLGSYDADLSDAGTVEGDFVSQTLVGGRRCDETGAARESQVRFYCCDPEQADPVSWRSLDEPETCRYVLSLCSPRLCRHLPAKAVDVPTLLGPLKGTCHVKNEGWWSYEFCYGQHVKQFHVHSFKDAATGDVTSITQGEYLLGATAEVGRVMDRPLLDDADPARSSRVYAQVGLARAANVTRVLRVVVVVGVARPPIFSHVGA